MQGMKQNLEQAQNNNKNKIVHKDRAQTFWIAGWHLNKGQA